MHCGTHQASNHRICDVFEERLLPSIQPVSLHHGKGQHVLASHHALPRVHHGQHDSIPAHLFGVCFHPIVRVHGQSTHRFVRVEARVAVHARLRRTWEEVSHVHRRHRGRRTHHSCASDPCEDESRIHDRRFPPRLPSARRRSTCCARTCRRDRQDGQQPRQRRLRGAVSQQHVRQASAHEAGTRACADRAPLPQLSQLHVADATRCSRQIRTSLCGEDVDESHRGWTSRRRRTPCLRCRSLCVVWT
mmetsp:Transcript_3156/g.19472  ORF Transcript_3156/g.19472 Transcript_3156/m.19472 type:complete len:247 (+) Transcript_3156:1992-2732(+)